MLYYSSVKLFHKQPDLLNKQKIKLFLICYTVYAIQPAVLGLSFNQQRTNYAGWMRATA